MAGESKEQSLVDSKNELRTKFSALGRYALDHTEETRLPAETVNWIMKLSFDNFEDPSLKLAVSLFPDFGELKPGNEGKIRFSDETVTANLDDGKVQDSLMKIGLVLSVKQKLDEGSFGLSGEAEVFGSLQNILDKGQYNLLWSREERSRQWVELKSSLAAETQRMFRNAPREDGGISVLTPISLMFEPAYWPLSAKTVFASLLVKNLSAQSGDISGTVESTAVKTVETFAPFGDVSEVEFVEGSVFGRLVGQLKEKAKNYNGLDSYNLTDLEQALDEQKGELARINSEQAESIAVVSETTLKRLLLRLNPLVREWDRGERSVGNEKHDSQEGYVQARLKEIFWTLNTDVVEVVGKSSDGEEKKLYLRVTVADSGIDNWQGYKQLALETFGSEKLLPQAPTRVLAVLAEADIPFDQQGSWTEGVTGSSLRKQFKPGTGKFEMGSELQLSFANYSVGSTEVLVWGTVDVERSGNGSVSRRTGFDIPLSLALGA